MTLSRTAERSSRRGLLSRLIAPLALAAGFGIAGCAAPSSSISAPPAIGTVILDTNKAAAMDVRIKWYRQPYIFDEKTQILDYWRVGDCLYISCSDFSLVCMDVDTGKTLWRTDLGYVPHIFRPANWTDYLVCMNRSQGVLIDRRTGRVVMRSNLTFACTTAPIVAGDTICVGTGADFFYGLYVDLFTKVKFPVHSEAGEDSFVAPPAVIGGHRMLAVSHKGYMFCVDPDFGSVLWSYRKVTGNVVGGVGADNRTFYVPSMDNKVFAFDCVDSAYLWDTHLEGKLDQNIVVVNKGQQILVPSTGKGLYCLEPNKGIVQWLLPDATQVVALSTTHAYVACDDGTIKAVRLDLGAKADPDPRSAPRDAKVDKVIPLNGVKFFATNLRDSTIFACTVEGRMMAISPEEAP